MRAPPWPLAVIALALVTAALIPPPEVSACAARGRRGPIAIEGEEALIVWDARRHMQHFVRRAAFAPGEDFGFLVPTPHRPQLAEVADEVFDRLFTIYRGPAPQGGGAARGRRGGSSGGGVRVLERRVVAGLDAAVLEASDARALDQWLATHGYQSGDALRRWVAPYVRRRWIVTAFRIAPGGGAAFRTRSMRMSFRASAPFFPYSEPADGPHDPRPFRVSVVAPYRTAARLGDDAWGARVGFAEPVETDRLVRTLSGVLGPDEIPANAWLTVFDEPASVRGTLDVTFRRAPQQTPVAGSLTTPLRPHGSSATGADPLNGLQGL